MSAERKADLLASLGGLLAVVTALPAEDFPALAFSSRYAGGWTLQVTRDGNGSEAGRRALVERIAELAGLPAPRETTAGWHYTADDGDGRRDVFTPVTPNRIGDLAGGAS